MRANSRGIIMLSKSGARVKAPPPKNAPRAWHGSGRGEQCQRRGFRHGPHVAGYLYGRSGDGKQRRVADKQARSVGESFVVGNDQRAVQYNRAAAIGVRAAEDERASA